MIFKFFDRLTKRRYEVMFNRGYDWAAGQLIRGRTISYIRMFQKTAYDFQSNSIFDDGAEQAIYDFKSLIK